MIGEPEHSAVQSAVAGSETMINGIGQRRPEA